MELVSFETLNEVNVEIDMEKFKFKIHFDQGNRSNEFSILLS